MTRRRCNGLGAIPAAGARSVLFGVSGPDCEGDLLGLLVPTAEVAAQTPEEKKQDKHEERKLRDSDWIHPTCFCRGASVSFIHTLTRLK